MFNVQLSFVILMKGIIFIQGTEEAPPSLNDKTISPTLWRKLRAKVVSPKGLDETRVFFRVCDFNKGTLRPDQFQGTEKIAPPGQEGWREAPGWLFLIEKFYMSKLNHHPVRSTKGASRHFIDVASTPPGQEG